MAFLFFPVFGQDGAAVDVSAVTNALLGTLPTGFITPFANGQIPQIILLGIIFGFALLMIGDSGKPVRNALLKVKEWVMGVMVLMMKVLPLVPFISTMMIVANGNVAIFLQGWKYIAATYICYLLSLLIVFIAVSARCKTGVKKLADMLKQIAVTAFITAMPAATMQRATGCPKRIWASTNRSRTCGCPSASICCRRPERYRWCCRCSSSPI